MDYTNLGKKVKHTDVSKIIKSSKSLCDKLLLEYNSSRYIHEFVNQLNRDLNILEKIYIQILKDPRLDWLNIQSKIKILWEEDSSIDGVTLHLSFPECKGRNMGIIYHQLSKSK